MNEWKGWAKKGVIWLVLTIISPVTAFLSWYITLLTRALKDYSLIDPVLHENSFKFAYLMASLTTDAFIKTLHISLPILVVVNAFQYSILEKITENKALQISLAIALSGVAFILTTYIRTILLR